MHWPVTRHPGGRLRIIYTLPMGFSIQAHAVNLDFWNKKLSSDQRDFLTKKFKEMEDEVACGHGEWKRTASTATQGAGACKYGKKGKMTVVRPTEEDHGLAGRRPALAGHPQEPGRSECNER